MMKEDLICMGEIVHLKPSLRPPWIAPGAGGKHAALTSRHASRSKIFRARFRRPSLITHQQHFLRLAEAREIFVCATRNASPPS